MVSIVPSCTHSGPCFVAEVDQRHAVRPDRRGARAVAWGGKPVAMALTGTSSLPAITRSSPLAEKFSPSFAESFEATLLRPQEQLVGAQCAGRQDDDRRLDAPA